MVYKKTPLTVVLRRTQGGTFREFYLLYKFGPWWYNQLYNWETGPQPAPAQFDVSTGANRWTYVRWDKWLSSALITSLEDSVYCAAGKSNTITIPY